MNNRAWKDKGIVAGMFFSAALAMIFTQVAGVAANVIDGIVTSRFLGENAYSAVSLLGPFTSTLVLIAGFFSTGSQVVCSQLVGKGEKDNANRVFSFALLITLIFSALLVLGCIAFPGFLFSVCGVSPAKNDAIYQEMMQYLHGYMFGIPAMMAIQILGPMAVMDGRKKLFSLSALIMCSADIMGDLLNAIVLHGGNFGMGIATSVAFWIQLAMILGHFLRGKGFFSISFRSVSGALLWNVMKAGSPTFVRKLATILRDLLINRMNLTVALSTAAIAARGVQNDLNTLMFCIGLGIGKALLAMTGIYYGAKDRGGLRRLFVSAVKASLLIAGFVTVICYFGAPVIAAFYTDVPEAKELAVFAIRCMALSLVLDTLLVALGNYLQGIQNRRMVNLMNFAERFFIPVLTAFVLGRMYGSRGIMASLAVGKLLLGLIMFGIICLRCRRLPRSWEDLMFLPEGFGGESRNNREAQIADMDDVMRESEEAERFCLEHGADPSRARLMSLFVEEMAGNIVQYGKPLKGSVRVDYRLFADQDKDRICLCLVDYCEAFDPMDYYKIHKGENASQHPGIRMVLSHAKEIHYYNTFNANNLILYL